MPETPGKKNDHQPIGPGSPAGGPAKLPQTARLNGGLAASNPRPNGSPDSDAAPTAAPASSSLEPKETNVITAFLNFKPEDTPELEDETWSNDPEKSMATPTLSAIFRHSGWAEIRGRVFEAMKRTEQSFSRQVAFARCGDSVIVEQSTVDAEDFRLRSNHCHDRLCTPCARSRSIRIRDALRTMAVGPRIKFVTLTLCGRGEPLNDLVDRLYKGFRALRRHPIWEPIEGGAAVLEVKWSVKANRWHPHLHIICDGGFIRQSELSDAWRSITRDSYIVDIRAVKDVEHTLSYVTKYASKPLDMSFARVPERLDEAVVALKGRRLMTAFGTWHNPSVTEAEEPELPEEIGGESIYQTIGSLSDIIRAWVRGDPKAAKICLALKLDRKLAQISAGPSG